MSQTKKVTKSLAGLEDLSLGIDTTQQTRAGQVVDVHNVRVPVAVSTNAKLAAIDPNFSTYGVVVNSNGSSFYTYVTDRSGQINSTVAGGSWKLEKINSDSSLAEKLRGPDGAYSVGIDDDTVGAILAKDVYVIGITGQSNAAGANGGGPNPADPRIKTFDGANNSWGSSDYTKTPWSRSTPNGNSSHNNVALAFAHRLVDEHKAKAVYIVYDAVGGKSIDDWVGEGVSSVRYAAFKNKCDIAFNTPELTAAGKTKLDFLIWFQGEEDALTTTLLDYRTKFRTLDNQFRGEAWMASTTPMFVMGMSGLHTRYQPWLAQIDYCENYNRNCVYVNSAGLKTQYDVDQTGDYTHFLGDSLWEHGYYRIWQALHERGATHRHALAALWNRGSGLYDGTTVAITYFSTMVSRGSVTSEFPFNGPAASNAIAWGFQCTPANYSLAGGYQTTMETGANYSFTWGRSNTHSANAQYSVTLGRENTVSAADAIAIGRGNTVADPNCVTIGSFSQYNTTLEDPARFQVGIGTSNTARKSGLTIFKSGIIECGGNISFLTDNTTSVGTASKRASVIYAGTGSINTSDARSKAVRGALSEAELKAWAKVQPAIYCLLDAIYEKGEDARLHTGYIAQEVMEAFKAEGLDPAEYALFCEDEVFEEYFETETRTVTRQKRGKGIIKDVGFIDGEEVIVERVIDDALQYKREGDEIVPDMEEVIEEVQVLKSKSLGNRYGLRYTECLVFEAAYVRSKLAQLESLLAAK